jgi:hypothetical protein
MARERCRVVFALLKDAEEVEVSADIIFIPDFRR